MKIRSWDGCFIRSVLISAALALALTGCGGGGGGGTTGTVTGTTSYTVGGTVSGLVGSVVLRENNSGNNLTVTKNGTYTFTVQVVSGSAYNITVFTQPAGQTCTVSGGSGTISGNVTNVAVACTNNSYTVGGTISGLTGSVELQNNGGDNLTIATDGNFTFATKVADGSTYKVTVLDPARGQTCSVSTGAGTVSGGNVTNVAVVCSNNIYSVGGTVSGLVGSMELQDNNGDNLIVAANGVFTFATQVANGSPYSVTVLTQPAGQSCSVASGTGTIALANVTNVAVTCATNTHTIGGTVTGLNGNMVLQDNGSDNLTVSTNGSFTFATAVADGNPYNVSVLTQPITGQTCTVTGGSGTASANVTTVAVNCVKNTTPRFAYVANFDSNNISQYTIGADGSVTAMTTATVAAGTQPFSVTVDPSGKHAYAANYGSNNISQYTIGADGSLTAMTPATVVTGTKPTSITIDPSGKYAYAANYGSNQHLTVHDRRGREPHGDDPRHGRGGDAALLRHRRSERETCLRCELWQQQHLAVHDRRGREPHADGHRHGRGWDAATIHHRRSLWPVRLRGEHAQQQRLAVHDRPEREPHAHGHRHGNGRNDSRLRHRRSEREICLRGELWQQEHLAVHNRRGREPRGDDHRHGRGGEEPLVRHRRSFGKIRLRGEPRRRQRLAVHGRRGREPRGDDHRHGRGGDQPHFYHHHRHDPVVRRKHATRLKKDPVVGVFLCVFACGTGDLLSTGPSSGVAHRPQTRKIPTLSLLNFDVATCVAIF